jgi:hypothetical protein
LNSVGPYVRPLEDHTFADHWAVPHADADDYFWVPTVPPYVVKRPEPERVPLMEALFVPRDAWVLSGSLIEPLCAASAGGAPLALSQEAFAELIGYHRTYVGGLERGERNLTLKGVERIAERLEVPALSLLVQN